MTREHGGAKPLFNFWKLSMSPFGALRTSLVPAVLLGGILLAGCASEGGVRPTAQRAFGGAGGVGVLRCGQAMVDQREILPGDCWSYIDTVYTRAGYPESRRQTVYKTRKSGPYADAGLIKPGDWLYFVNHSYGNIEHSSIFVEWSNRPARKAKMLSYGGEKRRQPGRYLDYDLSSVYAIIRPTE